MSTEQPQPMDGEQWAEASTRGALLAQLRGQREAGTTMLEEIARLRELLRPIWQRTFAETFKPEIPDRHWFQVGMTAGELRAIAALFVEEDDA
ncbi:MAG TPA: hypothetical protein VM537_05260 [Anaerolineae bacterium]|nr:hypothetical protein [Anaerolineae bacterium]